MLYKIIIIFVFLFNPLIGFSQVIDSSKQETLFIFAKYYFNDNSESKDIDLSKTLLQLVKDSSRIDTSFLNDIKGKSLSDFRPRDTSYVYVHIPSESDTAWRYEIKNERLDGFYMRIPKSNNLIIRHAALDATSASATQDLGRGKLEIKIEKFDSDTKRIASYNCVKYRLTLSSNEDDAINATFFGDEIYELYVAEELKYPFNYIKAFGLLIPDIFPLEIIRWSDKYPLSKTVYSLIETRNYEP